MPKPLLSRLAPDSIQEFRAAAAVRYEEAERLANAGHGAGAIYLWGYSAEMTIKAAYFSLTGFGSRQLIGIVDLRVAVDKTSATVGLKWPPAGKLHNVECWAKLLVGYRRYYGRGYLEPTFERRVVDQAERIYHRWREVLRYHKNRAYGYEVRQVHVATRWFADHSLAL